MPYFKDQLGVLHFMTADDIEAGFSSILPAGCEPVGDDLANAIINPPRSERDIALAEITALEATITPRRLREAVLGQDDGWLEGINSKISMLRACWGMEK